MNGLVDLVLLLAAVGLAWRLRQSFGRRGAREEVESVGEPVEIPESSGYGTGLEAVHRGDPAFCAQNFLKGAQEAYQRIITAFASGDEGALRSLVTQEVYEGFVQEIKKRKEHGHRLQVRFLKSPDARVERAVVEGDMALVEVVFVSEQTRLLRDASGRLLEKKEGRLMEDVWTFSRDQRQRHNPNWLLRRTQGLS